MNQIISISTSLNDMPVCFKYAVVKMIGDKGAISKGIGTARMRPKVGLFFYFEEIDLSE